MKNRTASKIQSTTRWTERLGISLILIIPGLLTAIMAGYLGTIVAARGEDYHDWRSALALMILSVVALAYLHLRFYVHPCRIQILLSTHWIDVFVVGTWLTLAQCFWSLEQFLWYMLGAIFGALLMVVVGMSYIVLPFLAPRAPKPQPLLVLPPHIDPPQA